MGPQSTTDVVALAPQEAVPAPPKQAPQWSSLSIEDRRRIGLEDDDAKPRVSNVQRKELQAWWSDGPAEISWLLDKSTRDSNVVRAGSLLSGRFGSSAPSMARTLAQLEGAGIRGPLALLHDSERRLVRERLSDDD